MLARISYNEDVMRWTFHSPPLAGELLLLEEGPVGTDEGDLPGTVAHVEAHVVALAAHLGVGIVTWQKK